MHRAALHAERPLAVETATRLLHSLLGIVAVADLAEVLAPHFGCLLAHGHPRLGRQLLMGDPADMALVVLTQLLFLQQLATLDMVIHRLTVHTFIEIDERPVKLGTIHAGELSLPTHLHTAGTAHTCAIDHQRVEADHARDAQLLGL